MTAPVVWFDEIDSTNAEARRRAEGGGTGPVWLAARRQSAGRGRRGRPWSSETGNLFATLLLTTARPPAEAAQASFLAALAVADLLDAFAVPGAVAIKWPNDVTLAGRKASGILLESGARPGGDLWLAVGIGVNLAHAPEGTERPATALRDHLRPDVAYAPSPETALDVLAPAFAAWAARWETQGFAPVLEAWRSRTGGPVGPCVARLPGETLSGEAEGVAPDGALRLRLGDGTLRLISAGDVFFGEAA
jgi:BirA family biotin operon repressor/biotin-[acetyl-CoA-carboxylase] ligase